MQLSSYNIFYNHRISVFVFHFRLSHCSIFQPVVPDVFYSYMFSHCFQAESLVLPSGIGRPFHTRHKNPDKEHHFTQLAQHHAECLKMPNQHQFFIDDENARIRQSVRLLQDFIFCFSLPKNLPVIWQRNSEVPYGRLH